MNGTKIIYIKEPESFTDGPTPSLGSFCPQYVYIDGTLISLLRRVEVFNDLTVSRPILRIEKVMYGRDDEILTLTPEEFKAWRELHHLKGDE